MSALRRGLPLVPAAIVIFAMAGRWQVLGAGAAPPLRLESPIVLGIALVIASAVTGLIGTES